MKNDFEQLPEGATPDNLDTANAPEPGQRWVFDASVAASFSDMLARSIPGYRDMRAVIDRVTETAFSDGPITVIDLGSSNGESVANMIDCHSDSCFLLTDISAPMRDALEARFNAPQLLEGDRTQVMITDLDLRQTYSQLVKEFQSYCGNGKPVKLIQSILTLIFVPINYRTNIIQAVYDTLSPGGMFVITEKLLGGTAKTQNILVDAYHDYKYHMGYSYDAIERKRMSLEYVQVPQSVGQIVHELQAAGFNHIECVHRYLNFGTFIAIK